MPEITMPRLSDSMEEGILLTWLVADGSTVAAGDEIVEIETDKTTMSFEVEWSGTVRHGVPAGQSVPVGSVIGTVEAAPTTTDTVKESSDTRTQASAPVRPVPDERPPRSSPSAARLSRRASISLDEVPGSGPAGRILRRDVIAAIDARGQGGSMPRSAPRAAATTAATTTATATAAALPRPVEKSRTRLTRVQRLIAARMVDSTLAAPHFAVTRELALDRAHVLRERLSTRDVRPPSYNDIIVAAVARTLPAHPRLSGRYDDGDLVTTNEMNIAIAVATADSLSAPVIRNADRLSLDQIAAASRTLQEKTHEERLKPDDLAHGCFTVSNLGMYGVRRFTAIINPGQAAILSVGSVREEVVVADGAMRVGWRAEVTLTCDHRIAYGLHAARFLQDLDALLQDPDLLL